MEYFLLTYSQNISMYDNTKFYFYSKYEQAIRTYEGEDPLGPRFEYIKWLEQVYLQHGPNSNLLPLIEETVQKFKNDVRYKQDLRFIQILINFVSIFVCKKMLKLLFWQFILYNTVPINKYEVI